MRKLAFLFSVACLLGLVSCDNRENVEGQWQSSAVKLNLSNTSTSSAYLSYVFNKDGSVTLSSDIDITEPLEPITTDSIVPYQVSVSAVASINGSWQYAKGENDEVVILFDDESFNISIDPDAVEFAVNNASGAQAPQMVDMKQAVIDRYKAFLSPEIRALFTKFGRLDDIKVDKNFLNCEIDDTDYIFRSVQ